MSCHVISCHIISCRIMSYHVMSCACHIMRISYHAHITSHHVVGLSGALTSTLVITFRKFVSLLISILYFANPFTCEWDVCVCVHVDACGCKGWMETCRDGAMDGWHGCMLHAVGWMSSADPCASPCSAVYHWLGTLLVFIGLCAYSYPTSTHNINSIAITREDDSNPVPSPSATRHEKEDADVDVDAQMDADADMLPTLAVPTHRYITRSRSRSNSTEQPTSPSKRVTRASTQQVETTQATPKKRRTRKNS